jgi:hypothetical protein
MLLGAKAELKRKLKIRLALLVGPSYLSNRSSRPVTGLHLNWSELCT